METIFGAYGMAGETITHQPGPSRAQQGPATAPKYKTPPSTRATHPSWLIMEHSTKWGPLDSVQLVYNSNNYGL